jgi:two-component system sensor histidine kinase BaeS
MPIKLSIKLFGAFFLIMVIVVSAMVFSRYLFFRNFRLYILQEEIKQLEALVPSLQEAYQEHGNWESVLADPASWRRQLTIEPHVRKAVPPPPSKGERPAMEPRVLLTDDRQQAVIGTPAPGDQVKLVAIQVSGKTVGWLGLRKREPFKSGSPAALVRVHTQQLYILGAAVMALTAFIAFLFARHLLNPIQRLARGTRELADRNFRVRIAPTTRDELGQLANNFNAMAETLENYETMRRQWLTDISHELRTPLAVLRGEIEALQDGIRRPSPGNLSSLHAEILRISKLVEDLHLLSLADADRLPFRKERIAPVAVLTKALASYDTRFRQHAIVIKLKIDGCEEIRIKGDTNRLEQVFTNIFENACKYVPPQGVLKITGQRRDQALRVTFADSGPGVPKDALPRLFDRLYRVDPSRNRESGGSGLGLSICQHIIQNHGGRIWAEPSALGGLAIGIELPLAKNENG